MFRKTIQNQSGVSMVELMLAFGGLITLGVGYMYLNGESSKSMKGMNDVMNANSMGSIIFNLIKDPNSCTASVYNAFPSAPPTMSGAVEINQIVQAKKVGNSWTTEVFYETGKKYSNLKLESITVRPYIAAEDQTPNDKLILKFKSDSDQILTRKYEFFYNNYPQPIYPSYAFSCSGKLQTSYLGNMITVPSGGDLPCNVQTHIACPTGTRPVSCGVIDLQSTSDEDVVTCYLDIPARHCAFSHELSGNCDTIQGECYCL